MISALEQLDGLSVEKDIDYIVCTYGRKMLATFGPDVIDVVYRYALNAETDETLEKACFALVGITKCLNGVPDNVFKRIQDDLRLHSPLAPRMALAVAHALLPSGEGSVFFRADSYYSDLSAFAGEVMAMDWEPLASTLLSGLVSTVQFEANSALKWIKTRELAALEHKKGNTIIPSDRVVASICSPQSNLSSHGYDMDSVRELTECIICSSQRPHRILGDDSVRTSLLVPEIGQNSHRLLQCDWKQTVEKTLLFFMARTRTDI